MVALVLPDVVKISPLTAPKTENREGRIRHTVGRGVPYVMAAGKFQVIVGVARLTVIEVVAVAAVLVRRVRRANGRRQRIDSRRENSGRSHNLRCAPDRCCKAKVPATLLLFTLAAAFKIPEPRFVP